MTAVRCACLAASLALAGCSSVGGLTGAVAGIATGAATANPAVGIAVSISVKAATDAGIKHVTRRLQKEEQDLIASIAGHLPVGEIRPWRMQRSIPYGNEHGELQVTRQLDTPLAQCRDVAFSVANDSAAPNPPAASWYTTSICLQLNGWQWAAAEPAVPRWGALQ
ncbi:MAG: hypothetical protein ABIP34_06465 [Rhodoferax sp.]|uniref:hypothetical protein n=1 Tax=Rhodoferax sp. TaxID=50421 RepID=UPI003265B75B